MESRTRDEIVARAVFLADQQGFAGIDQRHEPADLAREANAAIRALLNLVQQHGAPYNIVQTDPATLTGTKVSGFNRSEVPWPTEATAILGVDVSLGTGGDEDGWFACRPAGGIVQRNFYRGASAGLNRYGPFEFSILRIPSSNGSSVVSGVIALYPGASDGQYSIWYIKDFIELTEGDHIFLGMPDWHEWIAQFIVQSLAERDDDAQETYGIATAKLEKAEERIKDQAAAMNRSGPIVPRRVRARRGRWRR
jgi:hypothetical protein